MRPQQIGWLVVVFLGFALTAQAQPSPVHLQVDVADAHSIRGWTVNCYTGQQPPLLRVWHVEDGQVVPLAGVTVEWRLSRPDVRDSGAYTWLCNGNLVPSVVELTEFLGFHAVLPPLSSGTHYFAVQVTGQRIFPTTDPALGTKFVNVTIVVP